MAEEEQESTLLEVRVIEGVWELEMVGGVVGKQVLAVEEAAGEVPEAWGI